MRGPIPTPSPLTGTTNSSSIRSRCPTGPLTSAAPAHQARRPDHPAAPNPWAPSSTTRSCPAGGISGSFATPAPGSRPSRRSLRDPPDLRESFTGGLNRPPAHPLTGNGRRTHLFAGDDRKKIRSRRAFFRRTHPARVRVWAKGHPLATRTTTREESRKMGGRINEPF